MFSPTQSMARAIQHRQRSIDPGYSMSGSKQRPQDPSGATSQLQYGISNNVCKLEE
jgi:hypothetical protein